MTDATSRTMQLADRRGNRRTLIALIAAVIALGFGAYAVLGVVQVNRRAASERSRANTATSSAQQLCQQVRQLGGTCVVDPAQLRGDPGPAGPQGAVGPAGVPGLDGLDGSPGAIGPVGSPGATGSAGDAGPVGPQGPAGPTGPQGDPGPTGEPGAAGPAGPDCPAGTHPEQTTVLTMSGTQTIQACVVDPSPAP